MGADFKGITATHKELTESGHFHTAKLIVLRNLYLQNKNPPALTNNSIRHLKSPPDKVKGGEKTCLNKE